MLGREYDAKSPTVQHGAGQRLLRQHYVNTSTFFRKLLKGLPSIPHKLVTDTLASYGAAHYKLRSSVPHDQGARQNNRVEVSHQPTRQRERQMRHFTSPRQAQQFLAVHALIT